MRERLRRFLNRFQPAINLYALLVIRRIENDPKYRHVIDREGNISFCPRCGQTPTADYRKDEAFMEMSRRFPSAKRSDINFAIEWGIKNQ